MFEAIFEPIILGLKADEHAGRLSMTSDNDLLCLCLTQITRQVILDFRERNFSHSTFPNWASHDSASDFSTPPPERGRSTALHRLRSNAVGWGSTCGLAWGDPRPALRADLPLSGGG